MSVGETRAQPLVVFPSNTDSAEAKGATVLGSLFGPSAWRWNCWGVTVRASEKADDSEEEIQAAGPRPCGEDR